MVEKQPKTESHKGTKKSKQGYIPGPKKDEVLHIRVPRSVKERIVMLCKNYGLKQSELMMQILYGSSIQLYQGAQEVVYNMAFIAKCLQELKGNIDRANYLAEDLQLNAAMTIINNEAIRVKNKIFEQVKEKNVLGCASNTEKSNGDTKSSS